MKKIVCFSFVALWLASGAAQSELPNERQNLSALVQQLQDQQKKIAANQEQIDAKLADLAEALRVARIYASRGGR